MPRCSICDCSSEQSISIVSECKKKSVSWDQKRQEFICECCLEDINETLADFEEFSSDEREPDDIELERLEFLEVGGMVEDQGKDSG